MNYFYHGIQCDKSRNFVHGQALKYNMKYADFRRDLLHNLLQMFNFH